MTIARRKRDPGGIITARLAGTAGRHVSRKPLEVDPAVAELRRLPTVAVTCWRSGRG